MTRDDPAPGSGGAGGAHRHTWPDIVFSLDDGHPWMTMRCPCGAERRIKAYERTWDPADGSDEDGDDDARTAETDPLRR